MGNRFRYDYHKSLAHLHVGCEPPRAYYIPFSDAAHACGDREKSERFFSLCGEWAFRFYPSVREVEDVCDVPLPDRIDVPRSWQTLLGRGYDVPNYTNVEYPFPVDPPHVPEDNPCGLYRRTFDVSAEMLEKDVFLNFEGVDSCFYVFLNGAFVGYSQVSHMTSEFNVTPFLRVGENELRVLVLKWCDGSYLEDQDKFRLSGIFREVYLLCRDRVRIWDYFVHPAVAEDLASATLTVELTRNAPAAVGYVLTDPDGVEVARGKTEADHFEIPLCRPVLWSDEQPRLYTLYLRCGGEIIAQKVGFRSLLIRDRVVYTNGKKVKLRGVNRHDSDPIMGAATSVSHMVRDLMIMKRHNINAIRTSHYPNDPRFLGLCDTYGFYVIDETDLECHGMQVVGGWNDLTDGDEWTESYLDRARRMMERDKNHPSVVMWSVGNESGIGKNHVAMIRYFHDRMPGCFVHSEDATRQFCAFPDDDKAKCQATLVDVDSRMYPSPEHITEHYLKDPANPRPFFLCEYSHAMGNGPGCLKDYWDLIWANDAFWGGCVWEFTDHSVATGEDRERHPHYTYGGDFNDFPNSGCFCVDGLVYPDRRPHTGLLEYKQVIAPFAVSDFDAKTGHFTLFNRRYFNDFSDLDFTCTLERNGEPIWKFTLEAPALAPQEKREMALPAWREMTDGGVYTMTVRATQREDTPWAARGYEVGFSQIAWEIAAEKPALASCVSEAEMTVSGDENTIRVTTADGIVTFDRVHGCLSSLTDRGEEWLASPVTPTIWRAPTDNDRNIRHIWQRAGYDRASVRCYDCRVIEQTRAYVKIEAALSLGAAFLRPILTMKAIYTVFWRDGVLLSFDVRVREGQPPLPRFGVEFSLPAGNEQLSYYGRGPVESYIDKRHASYEGLFSTTVTEHFEHYVRPQENMAHTDTLWMHVGRADGRGFGAVTYDGRFSFNCAHVSPAGLTATAHDYELSPLPETVVNLDLRQTGIGSNSCGPELFEKFRFSETAFTFRVRLLPGTSCERLFDEACRK